MASYDGFISDVAYENAKQEIQKIDAAEEAKKNKTKSRYRKAIKFVPYTTHSGRWEWKWQRQLSDGSWAFLEKGEQLPAGLEE